MRLLHGAYETTMELCNPLTGHFMVGIPTSIRQKSGVREQRNGEVVIRNKELP